MLKFYFASIISVFIRTGKDQEPDLDPDPEPDLEPDLDPDPYL